MTEMVGLVTFGSFTGNVGESSVVHFVYQQLLNLMMTKGYKDAWAHGEVLKQAWTSCKTIYFLLSNAYDESTSQRYSQKWVTPTTEGIDIMVSCRCEA